MIILIIDYFKTEVTKNTHAKRVKSNICIDIFFINFNVNGKLISRPIDDINIKFESCCILSHFDM